MAFQQTNKFYDKNRKLYFLDSELISLNDAYVEQKWVLRHIWSFPISRESHLKNLIGHLRKKHLTYSRITTKVPCYCYSLLKLKTISNNNFIGNINKDQIKSFILIRLVMAILIYFQVMYIIKHDFFDLPSWARSELNCFLMSKTVSISTSTVR